MTPTTIAIIGVVLVGLGILLAIGLAIAAAFAFTGNSRGTSLPSHRWRALQADADEKFRKRQLEEDYRTVISGAGYDVNE